jgi:hypothetical protein
MVLMESINAHTNNLWSDDEIIDFFRYRTRHHN